MKTITFTLSFLLALALAPTAWAARYSKHVQGDVGGTPAGAPTMSDCPLILDQVKVGATLNQTPGMDAGGFPPNTYNLADFFLYCNAGAFPMVSVPLPLGGAYPFVITTATSADTNLTPSTNVTLSGTIRTGERGSQLGENFNNSRGNFTFPIVITGGSCSVTGAAGTTVVACTTPVTGNCIQPVYGPNSIAFHTSSFTLVANCSAGTTLSVQAPACSLANFNATPGTAAAKYANCSVGTFGKNYRWGPEVCGNGVKGVGEQCDDGNTANGDCCSSTCQYEPLGTVCGGSAVDCDALDTCDGAGVCVDRVDPLGLVCRLDSDGTDCDQEEACDGLSKSCPIDICEAEGTGCTAGGFCDISCMCVP